MAQLGLHERKDSMHENHTQSLQMEGKEGLLNIFIFFSTVFVTSTLCSEHGSLSSTNMLCVEHGGVLENVRDNNKPNSASSNVDRIELAHMAVSRCETDICHLERNNTKNIK